MNRIHPGQSIGLPLSETERETICDSLVIPDEYIVRIRDNSAKQEVPFTLDDLDDFHGYVAAEANHCKYKKRQRILDGVSERINDLLARYTDEDSEQEDADDNTQSEDSDPIDRLLDFATQMEQVCEAAGFDFEEVLKGMESTRISSDEQVGLYVSPSEKEILLSVDGLSDNTKAEIRTAPAKKRKFQFTLHQINEFEAAVSKYIEGVEDPKKRKSLVTKLVKLQSTYVIDGEDEGFENGEQMSRAVVVHNILKIVKERRRRERAER